MTLAQMLNQLQALISTGRVSAEMQVIMPIRENDDMPEMGGDCEPISAISIIEFSDGDSAILLINTMRAAKLLS